MTKLSNLSGLNKLHESRTIINIIIISGNTSSADCMVRKCIPDTDNSGRRKKYRLTSFLKRSNTTFIELPPVMLLAGERLKHSSLSTLSIPLKILDVQIESSLIHLISRIKKTSFKKFFQYEIPRRSVIVLTARFCTFLTSLYPWKIWTPSLNTIFSMRSDKTNVKR